MDENPTLATDPADWIGIFPPDPENPTFGGCRPARVAGTIGPARLNTQEIPMSTPPIRVQLQPTGLECGLNELEATVQANVRRYAEKTLRPLGTQLDRLDPEAVAAAGSGYWEAFAEFAKLGITLDTVFQLPPPDQGRLLGLAFEELGWGDGGLAIAIGASLIPAIVLAQNNRLDLAARYPDHQLGCWGITEPDYGTDMLDASGHLMFPGARMGRANCVARIEGDGIVIEGQKSAWVSNGPTAQICILFCGFDDGAGGDKRCVLLVPLDLPGVSRGKPLDKMGQRALPQGEIFFDRVRVPLDHLVAGPDQYAAAEYGVLAEANSLMGTIFTGVARAAYEHALAYAQQRRQGGVTLMRHQSVRHRIFHMFRKVEAARALARQALVFNHSAPLPALQGSIASKTTATQTAFEVASEAIQMFGGNGMTRQYPVEKLLRDARASMIEDGCNEVLAIKGGTLLADPAVFQG
jgi:alkylation response protein AidB-like acyl-CoA dehydrogenase